jgi:hypothetical protein
VIERKKAVLIEKIFRPRASSKGNIFSKCDCPVFSP